MKHLPTLVCALALAGSSVFCGHAAAFDLGKILKETVEEVKKNVASQPDAAQAPTPALAMVVPVLSSRGETDLQGLFAKRTVTGVELIPELKAVRRLMGQSGSSVPWQQLTGRKAPPPGGAGLKDIWETTRDNVLAASIKLAMSEVESMVGGVAAGPSLSQLKQHLDDLIGDTKTLAAEEISLPDGASLSPQQQQRAVTMAAIVVATRITGKVLQQAQRDLASLDQEYIDLIQRRQTAAQLLLQAVTGSMPEAAKGRFSTDDLAYLQQLAAGMSVADFAADMGAQNLALRLYAATDPQAYAEYRAVSEGLTKRQSAALRTVSGVTAFGALLVTYSKEVVKIGKDEPVKELLTLGPLALAFLTESPAVMQVAASVVSDGLQVLVKSGNTFRVTVGDKTSEVGAASEVFAALASNDAQAEFQSSLFRDRGRGMLLAVSNCDATTAAQMLDVAVPPKGRRAFATDAKLPDADNFSFVNVFLDESGRGSTPLVAELLGRDHRPRLAQGNEAMARVQTTVAEGGGKRDAKPGYLQWNNDQLMRLVFVSRDDTRAQYAAMQIKGVTIRPVPSMQSLYAYERLADVCRDSMAPVASR